MTTVSNGQTLTIAAGETSAGIIVLNGGTLDVLSGGTADGTIVSSGGYEYVSSGGTASGTTLSSGSNWTWYNGAVWIDAILTSGAYEYVNAGGVASGTVVSSGGEENVTSGGTTIGEIISSGGYEIVSSGGTAIDTIVDKGGTLTVLSGGTIIGASVNSGGNEVVESGGLVFSSTQPVITVQNETVNANQSIQASSLIKSVSDPNNYSITYYDFRDDGGGGGYFSLNGVKQADGIWITVTAGNLSNLLYVGGSTAGSDTVDVAAWDGLAWSYYQTATITTKAAGLPVITVQNETVNANQSIQASSLIKSVSDPNNYAITYYDFRDDGSGGGYFSLNGVKQADGVWITVAAGNLSNLVYVGGSKAGSETVDVAAWDGQNWSYYQTATVTTAAPQVLLPIITVQNETVFENASIQASSLISSVSDPNNYAITYYDFRDDGSGGGYFSLNGVKQADGAWITVAASNLSNLLYVGGSTAGSDTVDVAAWDGLNWSYYQTATVTTKAVSPPIITVNDETVNVNASIAASSLISSIDDPNNYAITYYDFRDDGGGSGYFSLNGVKQADGVWITVTAANLSNLLYVGGSTAGSEAVDVAAYDGLAWSNYRTATVTTNGSQSLNPVIALLKDPGIKADVTALLSNNTLTYTAMLKILDDVDAAGSVTSTEFADLKTLVANFDKSNGIDVSSYVDYISTKLIDGDPSNANWTGGALACVSLGNLSAGSSATQMEELIQKWFLGGDLPAPIFDDGTVGTYVADTNPLFDTNGTPLISDINQGDLGDCYLLASLAEIAQCQPSDITSMFTNNGNGTYGVQFYIGGQTVYVTVNDELPEYSTGTLVGNNSPDIWSSLVEKAYVELNAEPGFLEHPTGNVYDLIDDGSADPITQITGQAVTPYNSQSFSANSWAQLKNTFVTAIQNDLEVDFASFGNTTIGGETAFVSGHMYSGIGYDSTTGDFILRNPWGTESWQYWDTEFEASISDLYNVNGTIFIATSSYAADPQNTSLFVIDGGQVDYVSSGVTSNGILVNGGTLNVLSGGTAYATTVSSGGAANVDGVASATTLSSGGTQYIFSGGVGSGTWIASGGLEYVYSGGQDSGTMIDGRRQVLAGGTTDFTQIDNGGVEIVYSGGNASGTTVSSGGDLYVKPGGNASGTTVESGGTVELFRVGSDFTGDDMDDLVWRSSAGQPVIWTMNGTALASSAAVSGPQGFTWNIVGEGYFGSGTQPDLVWENSANGQAEIWTMNGAALASYTAVQGPQGANWKIVGVWDFNQAGTSDLVWENTATGQAEIWTMNGTSLASYALVSTAQGSSWSIVGVGDFTGSGQPDLLWENSATGQAVVWLMNGISLSSYGAAGTAQGPNWVVKGVADFNGDGDADILWENQSNGQAQIWLMNGTTVSSQVNVSTPQGPGWQIVGVGDFTGTGQPDIVWQNQAGQAVVWLMNGTTISSYAAVQGAQGTNWSIAGATPPIFTSGDIAGTGQSDLVWENTSGQAVIWTMNGTALASSAAVSGPQGSTWHIIGEGYFGNVTQPDLVWENTTTGQAVIWTMNGAELASSAAVSGPQGASWKIVGVGDFNENGQSDLVWENTSTGQAEIWTLNGTALASYAAVSTAQGSGWNIVGVGDFTGSGQPDLLWENSATGQASVWLMNGTSLSSYAAVGTAQGYNWVVKGVADFTGNGVDDILWENQSTGQAAIWLMNGATVSSQVNVGTPQGPAWQIVGIGDYNNAGQPDIVWQNQSGQAVIWLMNGTSIGGYAAIASAQGANWNIAGGTPPSFSPAPGDFAGTGQSDLVWQSNQGQAVIWTMNGTSYASSTVVSGPQGSTWNIVGEGFFGSSTQPDLVWENSANGQAVIWVMNGTSFASSVAVQGPQGANWTIKGVADFSNNGQSDLVWENTATGQAEIWTMNGTSLGSYTPVSSAQGSAWSIAGVGSFDGTGNVDLVWQDTNGQAVIWLMNGTSLASSVAVQGPQGSTWSIKAVADFNNNGQSDLVWENSTNGQAVIWTMNGTSLVSSAAVSSPQGAAWSIAGIGNYGAAGQPDIVWQNNSTGQAVIWTMNGTSLSSYAAAGSANGSAWHVAAA